MWGLYALKYTSKDADCRGSGFLSAICPSDRLKVFTPLSLANRQKIRDKCTFPPPSTHISCNRCVTPAPTGRPKILGARLTRTRIATGATAIGKTSHDTQHQWLKLIRHIEDRRLHIDTNLIENAIRPKIEAVSPNY